MARANKLMVAVIVGAMLDLGVAAAQGYQFQQLQHVSAKSKCWSQVLDDALNKAPVTRTTKAALTAEAHRCAKLPS